MDVLASGLYRARIRRKGFPQVTRSFDRLADAEGFVRKVRYEQERGLWLDVGDAERMTLRDALLKYLKEVTLKHRGAETERSHIRVMLDERVMAHPLAAVDRSSIMALRDRWIGTYAVATINRRLTILHSLFETARTEWKMSALSNPVAKVKLDGATERSRRVSKEEIDAICTTSESPVLPALVRLAVETAMRRGEWCKLEWSMVDLRKRTVLLPGRRGNSDGITKNNKDRGVPLSRAAVDCLKQVKKTGTGRFVCEMRPHSVTQAFARAAKRARSEYLQNCAARRIKPNDDFLVGLTFHDLRHEAASRLADRLDVRDWMKVVGHVDIKTTLRYYHPDTAELAKRLD